MPDTLLIPCSRKVRQTHRLLLSPMPTASCLHFFRLSVTLTRGRKLVAETTFCPESAERGLCS